MVMARREWNNCDTNKTELGSDSEIWRRNLNVKKPGEDVRGMTSKKEEIRKEICNRKENEND